MATPLPSSTPLLPLLSPPLQALDQRQFGNASTQAAFQARDAQLKRIQDQVSGAWLVDRIDNQTQAIKAKQQQQRQARMPRPPPRPPSPPPSPPRPSPPPPQPKPPPLPASPPPTSSPPNNNNNNNNNKKPLHGRGGHVDDMGGSGRRSLQEVRRLLQAAEEGSSGIGSQEVAEQEQVAEQEVAVEEEVAEEVAGAGADAGVDADSAGTGAAGAVGGGDEEEDDPLLPTGETVGECCWAETYCYCCAALCPRHCTCSAAASRHASSPEQRTQLTPTFPSCSTAAVLDWVHVCVCVFPCMHTRDPQTPGWPASRQRRRRRRHWPSGASPTTAAQVSVGGCGCGVGARLVRHMCVFVDPDMRRVSGWQAQTLIRPHLHTAAPTRLDTHPHTHVHVCSPGTPTPTCPDPPTGLDRVMGLRRSAA